ncbi:hypothetical protein THAOC_04426 [Thalassiosira oceanica]|uniref:Uncharacterized protein n=1 Tax=Thalassiosira oceanica TaxID=159749 RepID=K0T8M7_THAOC|nr:hypothetical protein THAOC_04426 [Thalassiosira oceanica]|eukprot:EJK73930.1 hypothetical protein THAOC_04426 [Thalassiosira oceanica]
MSAAPLALAALAAALSPFLAHSASAAQRGPPLLHLSRPEPRWISSANSPPARIGNSVSISPDDAWLYVTGDDGGLTKLDPRNGDVVGGYSPPDPGAGGEGVKWVTYCESAVEFHMDGEGGESFLVYWAFSLPSQSGMEVVSRVVAIRHDPEVEDVEVLWTTELEGIIEGTPVVGSDGDMIYFTMNTVGPTRAVTPRPTVSPTAAKVETEAPATSAPATSAPVTSEPTQSPDGAFDFGGALVDGETGDQTGDAEELTPFTLAPVPKTAESAPPPSDNQAPTKSPAKTFAFNLINPSPGGNDPGRKLGGSSKIEQRRLRNLQLASETGTGKLVVLSHSRSGAPIYEFDSRSLPNVQRHAFAAAGIARSPRYGNYFGGEGNRQDVVMWASRGGADARGGRDILVGFVYNVQVVIGLIPPAGFLLNRGSINHKG